MSTPEHDKQRKIDISNLRFYASLFREHQWEAGVLHWSVFEHTLNGIADRIEQQTPREKRWPKERRTPTP